MNYKVLTNQNAMSKKKSGLQLKIIINHSKPPIWRRIVIPSNCTFHDLHLAIQSSFDWEGYHLYGFEEGGRARLWNDEQIVDLSIEENEEIGSIDSRTEKIIDYLKNKGDRISYTYDFGDDWHHGIILEKIIDDYDLDYPKCIKASMHAPCEDSGSLWGWYNKLNILKGIKIEGINEEEAESIVEWMCEMIPEIEELEDPKDFDPTVVDMDAINEELSMFRDHEV